jgi:hypothetical protein
MDNNYKYKMMIIVFVLLIGYYNIIIDYTNSFYPNIVHEEDYINDIDDIMNININKVFVKQIFSDIEIDILINDTNNIENELLHFNEDYPLFMYGKRKSFDITYLDYDIIDKLNVYGKLIQTIEYRNYYMNSNIKIERKLDIHLDNPRDNTMYTIIIYLNNDYVGGETYIMLDKYNKFMIDPKKGKVLIFKGNKHLHGSQELLLGNKEIFVTYIKLH